MKKNVLTFTLVFSSGAFVGLVVAIKLFAMNIDLMGVPYSNTAVVAKKDIVIEQNEIKIEIPKGTKLVFNYSVENQPYYSLPIVGWPDEKWPFEQTDKMEYFYVERELTK